MYTSSVNPMKGGIVVGGTMNKNMKELKEKLGFIGNHQLILAKKLVSAARKAADSKSQALASALDSALVNPNEQNIKNLEKVKGETPSGRVTFFSFLKQAILKLPNNDKIRPFLVSEKVDKKTKKNYISVNMPLLVAARSFQKKKDAVTARTKEIIAKSKAPPDIINEIATKYDEVLKDYKEKYGKK